MIKETAHGAQQYQQKVWMTVAVVALAVLLIWILKATFNVLLLILAGALIALYFHGLSSFLHRKLHLKERWSLPVAVVATLLLLAGFFVFAGNKIAQQIDELSNTMPSMIGQVKQTLGKSSMGQQVLEWLSENGMNSVSSVAKTFFRSSFGVLGDMYVVLFLGVFFTASPKLYITGLLRLVPSKAKTQASQIIGQLGASLTKWLKGKLLAMLVVTVLTVIGLLILDVPMAFVLSLIAGILNFIPNFGPLIAMIPAVLIGLMQGPVIALLVAGLYVLVQVLESNLITPQIQKRLVSIAPALIIIAQLFMGVLTGGWGLVLATPLVLILMVIVKHLYVDKMPHYE